MKLSDVIKKRPEAEKPKARREGWGEGGTAPYFYIAPISDEIRDAVEEESVDHDKPFRTEKVDGFRPKKVKNIDPKRQTENMIYHAITGWDEFTLGALRSLMSLDYSVPSSIDTKTPIGFDEDSRRTIAQSSSDQFRAWVLTVTSDIEAYHAEMEQEAVGNSLSTSAGA